jgi:hypothetical protein
MINPYYHRDWPNFGLMTGVLQMDWKWPKPLARLVEKIRGDLSKPRWGNFLTMLMGLLLTQRVSHLTKIAETSRHNKNSRTSLGRFLADNKLDAAGLLHKLFWGVLSHVLRMLRAVNMQLMVVIDSTIRERASLQVIGSQIVKLASGGFGPGQIVVVGAVRIGPFTLPFWVEPIWNKHWAKVLKRPRRTQVQVAEDIIRQFAPPEGWEVVVLFDSFFACNKVLRACQDKQFIYVTNLKGNRKVRAYRPLRPVGTYASNILRHSQEAVFNDGKTFLAAYRDSELPGVGNIRLVFPRKPGHNRIYHLATNSLTATMQEIIGWYLCRWTIEYLFKDVKHNLGMGDYAARSLTGVRNHLRFVFMAHLLHTFQRMHALDTGKLDMKNASSPADIRRVLRTRYQAHLIQRTLRRKKMPANIDQIRLLLKSVA